MLKTLNQFECMTTHEFIRRNEHFLFFVCLVLFQFDLFLFLLDFIKVHAYGKQFNNLRLFVDGFMM